MYKVLFSTLNSIDMVVSYNLIKFENYDIVLKIFFIMWESIIYLLIGNNEKSNSKQNRSLK